MSSSSALCSLCIFSFSSKPVLSVKIRKNKTKQPKTVSKSSSTPSERKEMWLWSSSLQGFFPYSWFSFQQEKHEPELPVRSATGRASWDDKQGMDAGAQLVSCLSPYCFPSSLQWRTYKHVVPTALSRWQTVHLLSVPTDNLDWLVWIGVHRSLMLCNIWYNSPFVVPSVACPSCGCQGCRGCSRLPAGPVLQRHFVVSWAKGTCVQCNRTSYHHLVGIRITGLLWVAFCALWPWWTQFSVNSKAWKWHG